MLWSLARWNLLFMYLSGPKRLKYIHTYIFLYTRNGILWQFLFPLGNQVPLVMGNFQMLAFICQVWHPPSPPKFKTYFLNRKKATETQECQKAQDKGVQAPQQVSELLPCLTAFSGALTCTVASDTSTIPASSCLRGQNHKCSAFGLVDEFKYRMRSH